MKKTLLISAAFVAATAASAQTGEITSNRGENWLSQDGDWGLIFDAQPLLNYVGNLFNGTDGNSQIRLDNSAPFLFDEFTPHGSNVIIGARRLVDANTAYRGRLRIGFGGRTETQLVDIIPDPQPPFPTPTPTVENEMRHNYTNIVLGAGLEKRVGSTRVVGVYGGEVLFGIGSSRMRTDFGNALSNDNQQERITESRAGSTLGFGLAGFAGIEWFFAPKMSLGGEYTWGLTLTRQGFGETTTEYWVPAPTDANPAAGSVTSVSVEGNPNDGQADRINTFGIDTGVSGARITLNFYFQ